VLAVIICIYVVASKMAAEDQFLPAAQRGEWHRRLLVFYAK